MDIKVLLTLVAIAEHGSFLAASRSLGLSPAAVSLHVKIIEEELGVGLFDRSVRPPTLTEAGRRTLARARRVIEAWEQMSEGGQPEVGGMLALGVIPTAVSSLLAPALAELRRRRPQLRFNVTTAYSEELEERTVRGLLDGAVMMHPASTPIDLRFDPVLVEPLVVVAPAGTEGIDDSALMQSLPFIRFRRHAWIAHLIETELGRRRIRVDAAMEIDTLSGVLALVTEGLGVSIVPAHQLASLNARNLRTLTFGDPPVSRAMGLLRRPSHPKAPQLEELMGALRHTAAAYSGEPQPEALKRGEAQPQPDDEHQIDA